MTQNAEYMRVKVAHLRTLIAELEWVRSTALSAAQSPSTDSVLGYFKQNYLPEHGEQNDCSGAEDAL